MGQAVSAYSVNIVGLSNSIHHFDFEMGDEFFKKYGGELLSGGKFQANVTLNKHETFIEVDFSIQGTARLVCDRSLEEFDYPIEVNNMIVFKFGETDEELSDEIIMIHRDAVRLELGKYLFEFIGLAVPMKKLHPKFQDEDDDSEEGKIVYTSGPSATDSNEDDEIDPRWNILKNLK